MRVKRGENGVAQECNGGGKREIPERTRGSAVSSHLRKSGIIQPGIKPGSPRWEAISLTAQPPCFPYVNRPALGNEIRLPLNNISTTHEAPPSWDDLAADWLTSSVVRCLLVTGLRRPALESVTSEYRRESSADPELNAFIYTLVKVLFGWGGGISWKQNSGRTPEHLEVTMNGLYGLWKCAYSRVILHDEEPPFECPVKALKNEISTADDSEVRRVWSSTRIKKGGKRNGRSPRKPVDQRHHPTRFLNAKIPGATPAGVEPSFVLLAEVEEASSHLLTADILVSEPAWPCVSPGTAQGRPLCAGRGPPQRRTLTVTEVVPTDLQISPYYLASEIWAALNIDVLRSDDDEPWGGWNITGMQERGETGDLRVNPPTSGIAWHDSHMRKSKSEPAGNRTRFAYVGAK
ncbi:hypothetical protein PR048_022757 [Dryococelus australis]|uniref:Uncharacterized protein n=1 Tax=Dryococelus australis TaxID=614101 RepID=A0ABQ9GS77_9NEOP|nr:hypothetical protein PR048_022757 [Dryococelus australis]